MTTGLATTLRSLLENADALLANGRVAAARGSYEVLLERAQERTDRPMEIIARSMLAQCLLRRKDFEGARNELAQAEARLDPDHLESNARFRATRARLAATERSPDEMQQELRAYFDWANGAGAWAEAVDACLLCARHADQGERVLWLERAVELANEHGIDDLAGQALNELALAFDAQDRAEDALEAWQQALLAFRRRGTVRQVIATAWAVGSLACRIEDWPLAQSRLDEAIALAERSDDCVDLLALALADLARMHEASGDVIEARRVLIRALALANEQDLPHSWPERFEAMRLYARSLELEV